MLVVAERIDDVELWRGCGKLFQQLLGETANHYRVDPSFEVASDVGDQFPVAEGGIRLQTDHVAAQFSNGDFECRSRSERGLLEEQRHVPRLEGPGGRGLPAQGAVRLDLRRQLETALKIRGVEIEDREKILQRAGHGGRFFHDKSSTGPGASLTPAGRPCTRTIRRVLGSVLRVDPHVLSAQIAGPNR